MGRSVQSRREVSMYEATLTAAEAGLAYASLEVGATALFILGGLFTVTAVFTLLKRNSVDRP